MRIKIIGNNDCARATRNLLRQAGFAVTEFLPAEAVIHAPHAGYAITIALLSHDGTKAEKLAPAAQPPDPAYRPVHPTHDQPAIHAWEALPLTENKSPSGNASSPTFSFGKGTGAGSNAGPHIGPHVGGQPGAVGRQPIHFDSVESALETAILRHVTQLSPAPVLLDRPGGAVHSERELRIVIPHNDESAAVAVEFGVLRGLLDLTSPSSPAGSTNPSTLAPGNSPSGGKCRKWWHVFWAAVLLRLRLCLSLGLGLTLAFAGSVRASPRHVVDARDEDGATLHLEAALAAAQGQFATAQMNLMLIGGSAISLGHTVMASSIPVAIASDQSALPVQGAGNGAVLSGQQAVTSSAVALGNNNTKTVCIKALAGNTINVYVGPSGVTGATGMELAPGNSYCAPATNTNLFYVIASTTGASVSWIGSN